MCNEYLNENGRCERGLQCQEAHGIEELRQDHMGIEQYMMQLLSCNH